MTACGRSSTSDLTRKCGSNTCISGSGSALADGVPDPGGDGCDGGPGGDGFLRSQSALCLQQSTFTHEGDSACDFDSSACLLWTRACWEQRSHRNPSSLTLRARVEPDYALGRQLYALRRWSSTNPIVYTGSAAAALEGRLLRS